MVLESLVTEAEADSFPGPGGRNGLPVSVAPSSLLLTASPA